MWMYKQIEQFYRDNYDALVKRFNRRAGGIENAEDVVQEAFCRALKYHDSFNPDRQELGAWFNTIINNTLVRHQKEQMLKGVSIPYEECEQEEVHECDNEKKHLIADILERMYSKSSKTKNILYLYFVQGYKMSEISQVVDEKYKSVQMSIHRFKREVVKEIGVE
jgi:RNA polymerase sigma factor (sigma-70 family)